LTPATKRAIAGLVGGVVAGALALVPGASWSVAALIAMDAASLIFVIQVWFAVAGLDAAETERVAGPEDESPLAAEVVLLAAGVASLLAVVFTIAEAGNEGAPQRGFLTVLAIVSVALAWTAVHTVFILRYARLYYSPPNGGIDFHGENPDYKDFAYLGLTIGMTYQVSDTDLAGKRIRHVALRHALLSYVFGTVIVATTISSVAALL
jgi:uncharacterized membrane protein